MADNFVARFTELFNAGHIRGELTPEDWRVLLRIYQRDPAYLRYLASVHGQPDALLRGSP